MTMIALNMIQVGAGGDCYCCQADEYMTEHSVLTLEVSRVTHGIIPQMIGDVK